MAVSRRHGVAGAGDAAVVAHIGEAGLDGLAGGRAAVLLAGDEVWAWML